MKRRRKQPYLVARRPMIAVKRDAIHAQLVEQHPEFAIIVIGTP
jgi:hypothetical protein